MTSLSLPKKQVFLADKAFVAKTIYSTLIRSSDKSSSISNKIPSQVLFVQVVHFSKWHFYDVVSFGDTSPRETKNFSEEFFDWEIEAKAYAVQFFLLGDLSKPHRH